MAKPHWTPDPQRLESSRALLRPPAAAPTLSAERAAELLASAGTLRALRAESDARALLAAALPDANRALLDRALPALAPDALEAAVLEALDAAPALGLGGPDEPAARERVLAALATRDRLELVLLGAECLAGSGAPAGLPQELDTALAFFEQTLRPALYKLVPLGEARSETLRWVAPELRERFWWRSQGADVPADGLDQLSAAALLIARFPEARGHLDAMVAAQARLDRAGRPAEVVSLRAWAARRARRAPRRAEDEGERLAVGFASGETVLLRHEGFTVSFAAPDELLVDLLAERDGRAPPTLTPAGGEPVAGEEVPDCLDRFRFKLDGALASAAACRLRVPLASGAAEVGLPADDA